jgi:hypothetical protein
MTDRAAPPLVLALAFVTACATTPEPATPRSKSRQLARDLEQCAGTGEVKLTFYPSEGHNAWTETYRRTDLYEWFLKYRSESP